MGQADIIGTGRDQALVHPVMTEITFAGLAGFFIKSNRLVGTGFDAGGAAVAGLVIQNHQTVVPLGDRFHGAGIKTFRDIAVAAEIDPVDKIKLAVGYLRAVFRNGNILDSLRGLIFLLAGHLAAFTAPAGFFINRQGIFFHKLSHPHFSYLHQFTLSVIPAKAGIQSNNFVI